MEPKGVVRSPREAKTFIDGAEFIREYFRTDRLTFGVSELLPGAVGGLDRGHSEADEVFYCAQGHVLCYFPEDDKYYEMQQGDALLIPQGVGHRLHNIGLERAVIIWCCAPHP